MPLGETFRRKKKSSKFVNRQDRITSPNVLGNHTLDVPTANTNRITPDSDLSNNESTSNQLPKRLDKYGLHFLNEQRFKVDQECSNKVYFVDIVAMHGLNDDAYDTWTSKKIDKM